MLGTLVLLLATRPHTPAWLDRSIAGYVLKANVVGVYDSRSGFFVLRDVDCGGSGVRLLLTRDRYMVSGAGYMIPNFLAADAQAGSNPLTTRRLRSLATGKGVAIGDSSRRIRAILGKPGTIKQTGSRRQYVEYIYKREELPGGVSDTQTYTLRRGRLIQIDFDTGSA